MIPGWTRSIIKEKEAFVPINIMYIIGEMKKLIKAKLLAREIK